MTTALAAVENPYLEEVREMCRQSDHAWDGREMYGIPYPRELPFPRDWVPTSMLRRVMARRYAWAIPNRAALEAVRRLRLPVVEVGAGAGYWALLLARSGVDVVAYDVDPPERQWWPVHHGDATRAAWHRGRALLLCWPPYGTPMASDALRAWGGEHLVYVGEADGGCNGDDAFHEILRSDFDEVECVAIPQWEYINDWLWVYRRRR